MTGSCSTSPLSSLPPSPRLTESDSDGEEAQDTDTASGKELFYVERIIARSTDTFPRRGGGREHRYLVRWWSYTPNEDTWEPKSELVKTVPSVLEAFDANDHPFTILDRRVVEGQEMEYHVRYGWSSRLAGHSPQAQVVWHTAAEIVRMGVSAETLSNAESAWEAGLAPRPTVCVTKPAASQGRKVNKQVKRGKAGYTLLRFVEEVFARKGGSGRGKKRKGGQSDRVLVEFKVRRGKARQQWFAKGYLSTVFGSEQVKAARERWEAEQQDHEEESPEAKGSVEPDQGVSEYEAERIRNIDENKELLRTLGFGVD